MKICSKCKVTQPLTEFSKRKTPRTKGKRVEYYCVCKTCMRKNYVEWVKKNQQKVLAYEKLRSHFRRVVKPRCARCNVRGELCWYKFNNQRALYHNTCATQKYYDLGDVPPQRRQELLDLANEGVY